METKVRITWFGKGGELDSVIVVDDGGHAIEKALGKLIESQIVCIGDSFTVEEVEAA